MSHLFRRRRCQNAGALHIIDAPLTSRIKNDISANRRDHLMKFEMTSFQAVAANLPVEGEVCDIGYMTFSTEQKTDTEIATLIEKIGATSIAEI